MGKIEKILDKEAKTINQIIDDHEALKEAVKKICICPKDLPKNIAVSNCPAHNPLPQPEKQPEVGSCKRCGLPLSQCSEGRWEKPLCVDRNGTEYDEHIVGLSTFASYGQKREQVGREAGRKEIKDNYFQVTSEQIEKMDSNERGQVLNAFMEEGRRVGIKEAIGVVNKVGWSNLGEIVEALQALLK